MKFQNLFRAVVLAAVGLGTAAVQAVTTGVVPADGIYRFTFGAESVAEGFAVPASAIYDASHAYANSLGGTFTYGFLGTTAESYKNDVPWSLPSVKAAIDGFGVVEGQSIVLNDIAGKGVTGPSKAQYVPAGASAYEGRYPIRFSMSAETNAYYAVTCTVANVSTTATADVTLFSERCHIQAHHLVLQPNETRTFAWSVELWPNVFKSSGTYVDDAINVVLVGENAALQSLTVVKQPQISGTIRGVATEKMNVGKTMWLCDDSTGTDQRSDTPFFSLQNFSGVGSGLSRYAPANLAIRNQGEGGLATSANAHRKSCMLKTGDYLYVEYGHNESSTTSYTNNLEQYLNDVNAAGANLIIVSPVERRSSWNSDTSTWKRSLQSYAEAGETWVNDKIAHGATNVAFIDLNKRYNDWMNGELQRIHAVNPAVSLNAAISYYYRSAKGDNVDNTHINQAGTDQAAYWVWYDARARVAAGEAADATDSQRVQAAVLAGIVDGYQNTVGDSAEENLPWQIPDEIINAGIAPNAFWDTPVTSGSPYAHDAVVSSLDATANDDGSVTLAGVTMRILNPGNYYKAVVEVVSADAVTTNRYYSYYNYDVGGAGKLSGDLVDPEQPGFLTSDKDKADVTAADCATITIPAGAKAYAWIAEADAGTWQVGTNAPCSAKYPIEWWSKVIVDDACETAADWKVLTQAVCETNVVAGALYFMSTGADSANTKKNFGLYRALESDVASGRYRISFKAMIDAGSLTVQLGDAINTTTTLFKNSVKLLTLDGKTVTGYQALQPSITVNGDVAQAAVNMSRWVDVDLIVDRDNAKAWLSVAGSEYVAWTDEAFIPGSFSGLSWKYFGVTMPGQQSSYGYVDDVKIVKLAPVKSTSDKYTIQTWDDFSDANGLSFHQTSSDAVTTAGLVWANSANKGTTGTISYGKYIVFTPSVSGLLSIKFSVDNVVDKRNPTLLVTQADAVSDCSTSTNRIASVAVTAANTEYVLTANLEAGKTYYIWPYSYNWSGANFQHNYTIASIAYIYETPIIEKVPFFITGGQSNTDGRLYADVLPDYLKAGNAAAQVSTGSGQFAAWAPATGTDGQSDKWAYDAVTYYHLAQALGTFYVAKTSYGGTSIDPRVSNSPSSHANAWLSQYGGGYHWSADPAFLAATTRTRTTFEQDGVIYDGQSLLKTWIANIDASLDTLVAAGKEPEIKAILWHQGESDRTVAGDYKANLLQMVAYVRTHLVEKTGKTEYANLPFFCGTIPFASTQGSTTIDRTFLELDEDSSNNIFAVDIHDITLKSDNIHFSAEGAQIFGRRLYNRMIDEGVIEGEKVDEPYAVRKPDFGVEHVVNNTTTWTFSDFATGTYLAGANEVADINGLYLHGEDNANRGFKSMSANQSLAFSIGSEDPVSITRAPYVAGRGYGKNVTATTSAGNPSGSFYTLAGVNVGRAGAFEAIIRPNRDGATYQLYFNGKVIDEMTNSVTGVNVVLKGSNTVEGTYFINMNNFSYLFGARFVPGEEMDPVTVTIPASGVTTFGNIYGATFAVPAELEAFTVAADASDSTKLTLASVNSLNVGQAVVLRGEPGTYTLTAAQGTVYAGGNLLVPQTVDGTVEAVSGEDFANYLLTSATGMLTFTKSDGATVLPAGSAYLAVSMGSASATQNLLSAVLPPRTKAFDVPTGETVTCADNLSGSLLVTKAGEGVLTLAGNNTFGGTIAVAEGTLKLGAPYAAVGTLITNIVGEALETNRHVMASAVSRPKHSFLVWNPTGLKNDYCEVMGDYNNANWRVRKRNAGDTYWQVRNYNTWTRTVLVDGSGDAVRDGLQLLEETTGDWVRNSTGRLFFGSGKDNVLHEVVLYSETLPEDKRIQMETYLMAKWGIGEATYTQVPAGASIEVAAGATLDLGTCRPMVNSLTLEKGAIVTAESLEPGTILVTAQSVVDRGAKVVGSEEDVHLVVVTNGDGTQSLKIARGVRCFVLVLK